ncbi:hypothetical protein [Nonomuraea sp. NPDC049646]|uniref:hypothetical protein n=1 Tax=unclassified Nonomuraea TaxID=2593643 RepID=UPI0037B851AF
MEVPEFEAYTSGLEVTDDISDAEAFDRYMCMGSMIRRYIIWRNQHATDERLGEVVTKANVA